MLPRPRTRSSHRECSVRWQIVGFSAQVAVHPVCKIDGVRRRLGAKPGSSRKTPARPRGRWWRRAKKRSQAP